MQWTLKWQMRKWKQIERHVSFRLIQEAVQHRLDVTKGIFAQVVNLTSLPALATLQLICLCIYSYLLWWREMNGNLSQEIGWYIFLTGRLAYRLCSNVQHVTVAFQTLRLQENSTFRCSGLQWCIFSMGILDISQSSMQYTLKLTAG